MEKNFTKADLKDGMIVEYRNGRMRLVFGKKLYDTFYIIANELINYDETLCARFSSLGKAYDIVRVYDKSNWYSGFENIQSKLLWERKEESEVKEVTMAEVEEKFGCKVKIVK